MRIGQLLTIAFLGGSASTADLSTPARAAAGSLCSVHVSGPLGENVLGGPEVPHHVVSAAQVIVRARAERLDSARREDGTQGMVVFRLLEVIAADSLGVDTALGVPGNLVDRDDFNRNPVPYRWVRSDGTRGSCFAYNYRRGGEFLLLMRRDGRGRLTPYWAPLAPVNEQVRGADDPWVRWVRAERRRLRDRGGDVARPDPLPRRPARRPEAARAARALAGAWEIVQGGILTGRVIVFDSGGAYAITHPDSVPDGAGAAVWPSRRWGDWSVWPWRASRPESLLCFEAKGYLESRCGFLRLLPAERPGDRPNRALYVGLPPWRTNFVLARWTMEQARASKVLAELSRPVARRDPPPVRPADAPAGPPAERTTVAVATIAIGTRRGVVAVQRDGWITLTFPFLQSIALATDAVRVFVAPDVAERWVLEARAVVDSLGVRPVSPERRLPLLGFSGEAMLRFERSLSDSMKVSGWLGRCGPSITEHLEPSKTDLRLLAGALARAADTARKLRLTPLAGRPHFVTEVSCGTAPISAPPPPPELVRLAREQGFSRDVGVELVVDEAGRAEPGSIRFISGTEPRLAAAVRAALARWSFRPARRGGAAARQRVHAVLALDPEAPAIDTGRVVTVRGTADGWVRFRLTNRFVEPAEVVQEWFRPADVERWVKEVPASNVLTGTAPPELDSLDAPVMVDTPARLGTVGGIEIMTSLAALKGAVFDRAWGLGVCGLLSQSGGPLTDSLLTMFSRAAGEARRRRPTPRHPAAAGARAESDVACPARILPGGAPAHHPPDLARPGAEPAVHVVLTRFVIDTAGFVDTATLRVMTGSDRRAVGWARWALTFWRFTPATRGGVKVRQEMHVALVFATPPIALGAVWPAFLPVLRVSALHSGVLTEPLD